ncbi:MAG: type II secretion system F family protein [Microthrixaceae bacterium]
MTSILVAVCAAGGVYLMLPASLTARRSQSSTTEVKPLNNTVERMRHGLRGHLASAGLQHVRPRDFVIVSAGAGSAAALAVATVTGVGIPMLVAGVVVAGTPAAVWRRRSVRNREAVAQAWPRMIEEIRIRVGSLGQSIPQALLECEANAPESLRSGFEAARREWNLTTDFPRTVRILKDLFADPTADAVCETLLVVHEVGGDLDERLDTLAADRRRAQHDRREAAARQAGARVARLFVIIVPAGMAAAGLSLGDGAAAYRSITGQIATAAAVVMIALCWWWAGRIMTTPVEQRVFDR